MKDEISIIPVILAESEEEYRQKLEKIINSPELQGSWVQIDIVDGKFAPNFSVDLDIIKKYPLPEKTEIHLMVENPGDWIKDLADLGAKRVIIPIEVGETRKLIDQVKSVGLEIGLGLNPDTDVAKVIPFVDTIDLILLLSVRPGFGGQEFNEKTLGKIREVFSLRHGRPFIIEVDGGIVPDNAASIIEAGADSLAIGEHLINDDIAENLEKIWEKVS